MQSSDILVGVFSYNRPLALRRWLESARELVKCPIVVFDDRSDDPRVAEVVSSIGVELKAGTGQSGRLGGLYANMNMALDAAVSRGFSYLATIQDDMQFVRPLTASLLAEYASIFASDDRITQIDPRFVRGDGSKLRRSRTAPAFEWIDGQRESYSDVGIFSLERLTACEWKFADGERANQAAARALGMKRVYPFTPITMHVPFPSSFRRRERRRSGFLLRPDGYSYRVMSPQEQSAMDSRPSDEPPLFRKYLRVEGLNPLERLRYTLLPDNRIFR